MSEDSASHTINFEPISNPEAFAKKLQSSNIPVSFERAKVVGQLLLDEGASPELVGKIGSCFRFISKAEFDQDVLLMSKQITNDFAGKEYNLALHDRRGKSSDWLLSQLNIPKHVMDFDISNPWGNLHNLNRPNLIIDEWSVSGSQVADVAERVKGFAAYGEDGHGSGFIPEVHAYLLYDSPRSRKIIEASGAILHTISTKQITNLNDITTPDEREVLRKIKLKERSWKEDVHVRPSTTLTFGWWKIPDNFYELFVNPSPLGLINFEDYYPPYKDKSKLSMIPSPNGKLFTPF